MEQNNNKKNLWVGIPTYLIVITIIVLLCLFVPKACQKKDDPVVSPKLDVTCENCAIDGQKEIHNFYSLNDSVALIVKSDIGYALPNDVKATAGNQQLVKDTDYTYLKDTGEFKFNIKGDTNIAITANKKILNDCSWTEIKEISKCGKASEFFNVGDTKDVIVNNQIHKVRIIGFKQDKDKDGNDIGITFEFANLISDENGFSITTYWNDTTDIYHCNYNYLDSTIRAVLNGNDYEESSSAEIHWFQFFGLDEDSTDESKGTTSKNKHFSPSYSGKSVLNMLPTDLVDVLTPAKKIVNVYDNDQGKFDETTFVDKLFPLTAKEMGYANAYQEQSTFTYQYYEGHTEMRYEDVRIKQQINGSSGARTSELISSDIEGQYYDMYSKSSSAGYNDATKPTAGGLYYLRSPNNADVAYSWLTSGLGTVLRCGTCRYTRAVAPAFCV